MRSGPIDSAYWALADISDAVETGPMFRTTIPISIDSPLPTIQRTTLHESLGGTMLAKLGARYRQMKLTRRHPSIGTEVTAVDLNGPLSEATVAALKSTWLEHPVLIFPNQALSDAAHIELARHFGDIEIHPSKSHRSSEHPEIYRVSNVLESGEIMEAPSNDWKYMQLTWIWHSDSSFREVPSDGSILHGLEVTREGGETLFCNLYDVWDALDAERQAALWAISKSQPRSNSDPHERTGSEQR